jgi:hypothetical protein
VFRLVLQQLMFWSLVAVVVVVIQLEALLAVAEVREVIFLRHQLLLMETFSSLLEQVARVQHQVQQMEHLAVTVLLEL